MANFDFFALLRRITREHCELMGYPVPESLKEPLTTEEIPKSLLKRATFQPRIEHIQHAKMRQIEDCNAMTADQATRIIELCAKVCDDPYEYEVGIRCGMVAAINRIRALIDSPELAEIIGPVVSPRAVGIAPKSEAQAKAKKEK